MLFRSGKEIERKFLVVNNDYRLLDEAVLYKQGYLNSDPDRTVRVRTCGTKAYLTIKGRISGIQRSEYQYELPYEDAEDLLAILCEKPLIEKSRYRVEYEGFIWEIDEFTGDNTGLTLAEIELDHEHQAFPKPGWVGEEVSHDYRYLNSNLTKNPYKNWT